MRISDGSSDVCASDLKSVSTGCVKLRPSSLETSSVLPAPTNTTLPLASTLPPNSDEPVGTLLSCQLLPSSPLRNTWPRQDRKRVVKGKGVSVRVDPGGRRIITKQKNNTQQD